MVLVAIAAFGAGWYAPGLERIIRKQWRRR
jgi:hypothetical protein